VDGVIMLHEIKDHHFYDFLEAAGIPALLATFDRKDSNFCSIHVDEEKSAREAVEHLLSLGHRKIDMLSAEGFTFGLKRATGYRQALREAGIGVEEQRVVFTPAFTPASGRLGMKTLLERKHELSAVFAATDELAIGAMRAIWEAGLRVPQDISVMGFDDIDISAYLSPGLTTVRQPLVELGESSANLINSLICEEKVNRAPIILPHTLILRESTSQPRK
jgi:LacI family transcriptional regulator